MRQQALSAWLVRTLKVEGVATAEFRLEGVCLGEGGVGLEGGLLETRAGERGDLRRAL